MVETKQQPELLLSHLWTRLPAKKLDSTRVSVDPLQLELSGVISSHVLCGSVAAFSFPGDSWKLAVLHSRRHLLVGVATLLLFMFLRVNIHVYLFFVLVGNSIVRLLVWALFFGDTPALLCQLTKPYFYFSPSPPPVAINTTTVLFIRAVNFHILNVTWSFCGRSIAQTHRCYLAVLTFGMQPNRIVRSKTVHHIEKRARKLKKKTFICLISEFCGWQ